MFEDKRNTRNIPRPGKMLLVNGSGFWARRKYSGEYACSFLVFAVSHGLNPMDQTRAIIFFFGYLTIFFETAKHFPQDLRSGTADSFK